MSLKRIEFGSIGGLLLTILSIISYYYVLGFITLEFSISIILTLSIIFFSAALFEKFTIKKYAKIITKTIIVSAAPGILGTMIAFTIMLINSTYFNENTTVNVSLGIIPTVLGTFGVFTAPEKIVIKNFLSFLDEKNIKSVSIINENLLVLEYYDSNRKMIIPVYVNDDGVLLKKVPYDNGVYNLFVPFGHSGPDPIKNVEPVITVEYGNEPEWIISNGFENTVCIGVGSIGVCWRNDKFYIVLFENNVEKIIQCWKKNLFERIEQIDCLKNMIMKEISEETARMCLSIMDEKFMRSEFFL